MIELRADKKLSMLKGNITTEKSWLPLQVFVSGEGFHMGCLYSY